MLDSISLDDLKKAYNNSIKKENFIQNLKEMDIQNIVTCMLHPHYLQGFYII